MGRPPSPLIDKGLAVKAALAIVDAEGLEAISMRRLARELGVAMASLYYHFANKEELLRLVCEQVLSEVPWPNERTERLADFIERLAIGARSALLRHPNTIPLLVNTTARLVMPHTYERLGDLLLSRGVPLDMVEVVIEAVDALVVGSVATTSARPPVGDVGSRQEPPPWMTASRRSKEESFQLTCRALGEGFTAYINSSR